MGKEFEGLVQHISVLEAAQREQEAKLAAEIVNHNNTKAELQKVTRQEDRWKQKVTELQITFASVKAGLSGEERCNQQVKDEVRRLKQENNKIREAIKKDIDCMRHERGTFLKMIEAANDELRTLHATNKGAPRPVSIPSMAAPGSAFRPSALRERVEQLEKAVAQAADEKAELTLSLEAAVAELQPTPEDNPLPGLVVDVRGPITGLTMDAMDEEVKLLKAKSDGCVRLIEKHKALHNTTLGEYQELDKYISSLTTSLEELQSYCANLESSRQTCNHCNSSFTGEKEPHEENLHANGADAMDTENPVVPRI